MPGQDAKFGDAYWVNRDATKNPYRVGKPARPMACMAEHREDTTWAGLPRVSSDPKPDDQKSQPMPALGLHKVGWWSARFIHPVHKASTGVAGMCEYLGKLPEDELKTARAVYQNRLYDE